MAVTSSNLVAQDLPIITGARPKFGQGQEIAADGGFYAGSFRFAKREGDGLLVFNMEGTEFYEGQFRADFIDGLGRKVWPDGTVYHGQWGQGRKDGHGVLEEPSGRRYDGEWFDGKRHGVGTQVFDAESSYQGRWENGLQHGSGKYFDDRQGTVYEGHWFRGAYHGKGLLRGKDGYRESLCYVHGTLSSREVLELPKQYMPLKARV